MTSGASRRRPPSLDIPAGRQWLPAAQKPSPRCGPCPHSRPGNHTQRKYTMKNARLGSLEVSRIGLGAMTIAGTYTSEGALDNAESIRTIHRALDLGVTHIDTAEIYGPFHSEEIVGQAVKGRRDQVVIATKFGLVQHGEGDPTPGVTDSS